MAPAIVTAVANALEILAPQRCASCARPGAILCASCLAPLRGGPLLRRTGTPPVMALGAYDGALRSAVHALKYRNARQVAALLGALLGEKLRVAVALARPDVVVPVPLHPSRLRERGFNQSELIARAFVNVACDRRSLLGLTAGQAVATAALTRVRATQSQSKLDLTDRDANVASAFAPGAGAAAVRGKHVLLIDDVITTGATIRACAAVLRKFETATITAAALALRV